MKKHIGLVNTDSATLLWLRDKLKNAPPDIDRNNELSDGITELLNGETGSFILAVNDDISELVSEDTIKIGSLAIYPKSRKIERDGTEIALTPKEFDILYFLAKNKGEVFTKEQIYQAVWDDEYIMDDSNIMAFIRKLRKKIEPNPDAPEYILTIWGIGYKFNDKI